MTVLGLAFAVIFGVGALTHGRYGLLFTIFLAVPFNDSSFWVVGNLSISPYYVGLSIYLVWSAVDRVLERQRIELNTSHQHLGLLVSLIVYSGCITLLAPRIFSGMPVIASGIGLDEQIGRFSSLDYSSSNVAQMSYITMNLLFLRTSLWNHRISRRPVVASFAIGVIVAAFASLITRAGSSLPATIFDNSSRGFYTLIDPRARGQFSEPSHLGAYAITALALFLIYMVKSRTLLRRITFGLLASLSAGLVAAGNSGTAIVGGFLAVFVIVVLGLLVLARPGVLIPIKSYFAVMIVTAAIALTAPRLVAATRDLIDQKQGGLSYSNRGSADQHALDVLTGSNFLGVGLGSNRASSLIPLLLSTIGIVGTVMVLLVMYRSLSNGLRDPARFPVAIALIVFLSAAVVSLPDLASPILWSLVYMCYLNREALIERRSGSSLPLLERST